MTQTVVTGPAVLVGYEYAVQIAADAAIFIPTATFAAQLRSRLSEPEPLATLSTATGTLIRISDTVLEIRISAMTTAQMAPGSVLLDVVRTDLTPPQHLGFQLEIPVALPVTRGL